MLAEGVDTLVMGCTHFPFVIPLIQKIAGDGVRVIDPAPAVARQVARLLHERGSQADGEGGITAWASGDARAFAALAGRMGWMGLEVRQAAWDRGALSLP